jgi:hypothetical protein
LCLTAVPASAQIISTSIPKAETSGPQSAEKTFAVHFLAAPVSKWHYNEIVAADWTNNSNNTDVGLFSGAPNSNILLAGEAVLKVGKSFSLGGGGWYNDVGSVTYDFRIQVYQGTTVLDPNVTGTLTGDLKLSEGHVNFFYKDVGVQWGAVHTRSVLKDSKILSDPQVPQNVNEPLSSIETNGSDSSATDWDLYGVYKHGGQAGGAGRNYGLSAGGGIYVKTGSTATSQRAPNDQTVFSGFLTGTLDLYKGLGVDVSYWYIAKTKADLGTGTPVSSEKATNRLTFGFSYSFSR